jgi:hypothetical protein
MNTDEQFIEAYAGHVAVVDEEELREFIKCYNNNEGYRHLDSASHMADHYSMWETAIKIGENK